MTIYVSSNKANLNEINVSPPDFHILQNFGNNWTTAHIQKLADIPEIPVAQLYKHMIGWSVPFYGLPKIHKADSSVKTYSVKQRISYIKSG